MEYNDYVLSKNNIVRFMKYRKDKKDYIVEGLNGALYAVNGLTLLNKENFHRYYEDKINTYNELINNLYVEINNDTNQIEILNNENEYNGKLLKSFEEKLSSCMVMNDLSNNSLRERIKTYNGNIKGLRKKIQKNLSLIQGLNLKIMRNKTEISKNSYGVDMLIKERETILDYHKHLRKEN